jgi:hypothetical protein
MSTFYPHPTLTASSPSVAALSSWLSSAPLAPSSSRRAQWRTRTRTRRTTALTRRGAQLQRRWATFNLNTYPNPDHNTNLPLFKIMQPPRSWRRILWTHHSMHTLLFTPLCSHPSPHPTVHTPLFTSKLGDGSGQARPHPSPTPHPRPNPHPHPHPHPHQQHLESAIRAVA